jgi:hypothetical protein
VKSNLALLSRPGVLAILTLAVGGYAWWATALRPFSLPSLAATLAGGLSFIILGSRFRGAAGSSTQATTAGALTWATLLLLLGAWELAALLQHPREDHPTLSHLANMVLDDHPVRALAFLVWLLVGLDLSRR